MENTGKNHIDPNMVSEENDTVETGLLADLREWIDLRISIAKLDIKEQATEQVAIQTSKIRSEFQKQIDEKKPVLEQFLEDELKPRIEEQVQAQIKRYKPDLVGLVLLFWWGSVLLFLSPFVVALWIDAPLKWAMLWVMLGTITLIAAALGWLRIRQNKRKKRSNSGRKMIEISTGAREGQLKTAAKVPMLRSNEQEVMPSAVNKEREKALSENHG